MSLIDLHPKNPQPRLINKIIEALNQGQIIAYPTDSGYALGCTLGNKTGIDKMRQIRHLTEKHDFTLVLSDFSQLGQYVIVDNFSFRLIKKATPGPYTFILKGTKEVPKIMLNAKKHTVGARIPDNKVVQAILQALGQPLMSTSLILPGDELPLTEGWLVEQELGRQVDIIVDSSCDSSQPTTVISILDGQVEVIREGAGKLDTLGIILE